MADINYVVKFNLNFNASGPSRGGQTASITKEQTVLNNTMNYIINDIAFYAARKQQTEIRQNLEQKFDSIVRSELANMGRKIATMAVGISPSAQGPLGLLELDGAKSSSLAKTTNLGSINLRAYTGPWVARNRDYLARKRRKYGHTKWFQNTGELKGQIRKPSLYTSSFGPIRVKFEAAQIPSGSTSVARVSQLVSTRGRPSGHISVGKVQVSVLGRITQGMLADPNARSYDSRYTGLFDMLPEDVGLKLGGRTAFRSVIEPFLSFYLTRQIPNTVFRTLEESTRARASGLRGGRAFTG